MTLVAICSAVGPPSAIGFQSMVSMSHMKVLVYPAEAAAWITSPLIDPYGGRQYGAGAWPVWVVRMAAASVSSRRMKSAVGVTPAQGDELGEPPPPRTRSQWCMVWLPISNS